MFKWYLLISCLLVGFEVIAQNNVPISVKLTDDYYNTHQPNLSQYFKEDLGKVFKQDTSLIDFERIFPPSGKFEKRHQQFGLHLWYRVYISNTASYRLQSINDSGIFSKVQAQPDYQVHSIRTNYPADSLFNRQWQYENFGQTRGLYDADIDLVNALKIEKGKKEVIVSIHDSGIDFNHQELLPNLWVNQGEIPENGIDDDNNGYVDDVHGWNFVLRNNDLQDYNGHGTVIAGSIGAKSDGKGVLGIAGGDKEDNGVTIMICRMDNNYESYDPARAEETLVYAADNGAIISSNSWNTFGRSYSVLAALEYFKAVAASPLLDTGLVVFSAGNNGSTSIKYQKEVSNVIMIGSTNHQDKVSYFSNYGDWLDLVAPGEDIFSTGINGSFGLWSGTSFAAPHVTGVAALILSKYGDENFTLEELRNRLRTGADSIDEYNISRYHGKIGAGRLNAFKSLVDSLEYPSKPGKPTTIWIDSVDSDRLKIGLIAPDAMPVAPFSYEIRLVDKTLGDTIIVIKKLEYPNPSDSLEFTIDQLTPANDYQISIRAKDFFDRSSQWSDFVDFHTLDSPELIISQYDSIHFINLGSDYFTKLEIENKGTGTLRWNIHENRGVGLDGLGVGYGVYDNDFRTYLDTLGAEIHDLDTNFIAADLLGIHLIVLDDRIAGYSPLQIEYLEDWVKLGGKMVLGLDSKGIVNANLLCEEAGITFNPYDEIYYSIVTDVDNGHPITSGLISLEYHFQSAYLNVQNTVNSLLYDENENVYMALTNYGKGEILACSNQFFNGYKLFSNDNFMLLEQATEFLTKYNYANINEDSGLLMQNETTSIQLDFHQNEGVQSIREYVLETNDPLNRKVKINFYAYVDGGERSLVSSDSVLMDSTYVGYESSQSISLINAGYDTLSFTWLNSHSFELVSDKNILIPGDSQELKITFSPHQPGTFEETLFIDTDDIDYNIKLRGTSLNPPDFRVSGRDTLFISSLGNDTLYKRITLKNTVTSSEVQYSVEIQESKRSKLVKKNLRPSFDVKVIGVTNFHRYRFAIENWLFYDSIGLVNLKTPLRRNTFELDSLDLIVLDENLANLSSNDLKEIIEWVSHGGNLLIQTDLIYNNDNLMTLLSMTSIRSFEIQTNGSEYLKDVFLHPITEGLDSIYANRRYRIISSANPEGVLARDIQGNPYLVAESYGSGKIIVCTDELILGNTSDPNYLRFTAQLLNWFFSSKPFWLNVAGLRNSSLKDIESEEIDLAIISSDVDTSFREANIKITNNGIDTVIYRTVIQTPHVFSNTLPEIIDSVFVVHENSSVGTLIGKLKYLDLDSDVVTFSSSNEAIAITGPGEVFIADSSLYNFELTKELVIPFDAFDGHENLMDSLNIVLIDVNESPELQLEDVYHVDDSHKNGDVIGRIFFSDPESDSLTVLLTGQNAFSITTEGDLILSDLNIIQTTAADRYGYYVSVSDGEYNIGDSLIIKILIPTGLFESTEVLYPNPTASDLYLPTKVTQALIYDNKGVLIKGFRNVDLIDVSDLKNGVYIIEMIFDDLTIRRKLIKIDP